MKQVTTQTVNQMLKKPTLLGSPRKDQEKIKVSLFFKCFNCEEVGHCAIESPYLKIGKNNEKDDFRFNSYKNDKTKKR